MKKYYKEISFKNKSHFRIVSNFNLQLFFTPRCRQNVQSEPVIINGVKLWTSYFTKNDYKEYKDWKFDSIEVATFDELFIK